MRARFIGAFLSCVVAVTGCGVQTPIYRVKAKLLVSTVGPAVAGNASIREDTDRFIATQIEIMMGSAILRRVQDRLRKTPDEIRDNLANLKVAPVHGADIMVITVDSPSADFARDFASTFVQEYLKFRDELRAQTSGDALLKLAREINRLDGELKSADDRLVAFAKEHNVSPEVALEQMHGFREDRDRLQSLRDALLGQLVKIDASQSFNSHYVSVLEPATLERDPVH